MKFALSHITVAVGLAVVASSSFADPSGTNRPLSNYTTGTTDVYLAGSSAVDLALTKFFAKSCDTNTLDTYRSDAGVKTYYLWTCESTSAAGFGLASGHTKIAIHKNTNSSSDGVNLLSDSTGATVLYLKTTDLATCSVPSTQVPASNGLSAYTQSTCGTTAGTSGAGTQQAQPNFGFADSEPNQFNSAVTAQLTTAYPFGVVFGVVVSKNVRDVLQNQQFGVTGDETAAHVPNLTSAQINSIFTGTVSTWSLAIGTTTTAFSENSIYLVRRGDGSGSHRAVNTAFVGEFCTPGVVPMVTSTPVANTNMVTPTTECVSSTTSRRKQAATSDDMVSCVATFNSNGLGSIGYVSTDYQPQATDGYRFVKVDGYLPTLLNVIDGKYKVWSEESLNYNTNRGIPGDLTSFYTAFQNASASAAYLSAVEQGLTQTLGGWTGGLLGAQPNGQNQSGWGLAAGTNLSIPRTDASVLLNPANPLTRAISSGYNLCVPAQPARNYKAE